MVKKVTPITGGGSGDGKPPVEPGSDKVTGEDLLNIAKALEGDIDPDGMSSEEIDKLTKAFGKMFVAEIRGEDLEDHINPDELQPPVADAVLEAINKYSHAENIDLRANHNSETNKVARLFKPNKIVKGNQVYNTFVKDGYYHLTTNEGMFPKYRDYRGSVDKETVEKLLRRVDSEVRSLDAISREELVFNFVNNILGSDMTNKYGSFSEAEEFSMLKPESRELLSDLVLMYVDTKESARTAWKCYDEVNKNFNFSSLQDLFEITTVLMRNHPVNSQYGRNAVMIRPKVYPLILNLVKALSAALPVRTQALVESVLISEQGVSTDITSINARLLNPSKYLRQAFIAIAQGRGSFEQFFTALCDLQNFLDNDLNRKVKAARALISVYDSLGLEIADVLKNSSRRILGKTLF